MSLMPFNHFFLHLIKIVRDGAYNAIFEEVTLRVNNCFWDIFFRYRNARAADDKGGKCRGMVWALVVLWWLRLNPTGLLSPKLSPA